MEDDEDEWEYEAETSYEPVSWSWRALAHNTFSCAADMVRAGATWLDCLSSQFGCANQRWRDEQNKLDAAAEARRLLSALDEI